MLSTRMLRAASTSSSLLPPLESAIVHLPLTRWPGQSVTPPTASTSAAAAVDSNDTLVVPLPAYIFHCPPRPDILHQCVVAHLASLRQGTAHTKNRSQVKGSNRKIMRQKGTGKARVGDARSPIRRGGGMAFPKRQKDWSVGLNSKVWKLGIRTALSERWRRGELTIIPSTPSLESISSRSLVHLLPFLDPSSLSTTSTKTTTTPSSKTLFLLSSLESNFALSARNLPNVNIELVDDIDVYPLLHGDRVVLDIDAVQQLEDWLGRKEDDGPRSSMLQEQDTEIAYQQPDIGSLSLSNSSSTDTVEEDARPTSSEPGEGIHDNGTAGISETLREEQEAETTEGSGGGDQDLGHSSSNPEILELEESPAILKRNTKDPLDGNPAKRGVDDPAGSGDNGASAGRDGEVIREEMEMLEKRDGANTFEDKDRPNAKDIL